MFSTQFKHDLTNFMTAQGSALLNHQRAIADAYYKTRTGTLSRALGGQPEVQQMKVSIPYPKHIRFLDMKKTRLGKRKKRYAQIYNRYVYGYLKSPVWRVLMASIPKAMIRTMEETLTHKNR